MPTPCPFCGAANPEGALACGTCRLPLTPAAPTEARCRTHPEVPALAACGRCGTFFCAACLEQGQCAACRAVQGTLPWDQRASVGVLRAFVQTCWGLIAAPEATLARARGEAPLSSSLLFSALAAVAGFGTTFVLYAVFGAGILAVGMQDLEPQGWGAAAAVAPLMLVGFSVMSLVSTVVGVLLFAGIDHLALRLVGVTPRSYEVTVRANALALAPYLLGVVPVCGLYVFPIWSLVLRVLAIRALHDTTGGKAALAVLVPALLLCGVCGGAYAMMLVAAMAAGGASP